MTLEGMKFIARMSGCMVRYYSDSAYWLILLDVYERAKRSKAVAVKDEQGNKIIFLSDNMSEEEQMFAIAHELGHFVSNHRAVHNEDMRVHQEDEANEFATLLLKAVANYG